MSEHKKMRGDEGYSRSRERRRVEFEQMFGFPPPEYPPEPPADRTSQVRDPALTASFRQGRRSAGTEWPAREYLPVEPEVGLSNNDPAKGAATSGAMRMSLPPEGDND